MTLVLQEILGHLAAGEDLSAQQTAWAVEQIMLGRCQEGEIGLFLMGLRLKGETVEEVVGAAQAMRRLMLRVPTKTSEILDTCGTGGDGAGTLNISTAAAVVVAACGVPVAKHGNRSVSSRSGSADVLQALGLRVELPPQRCGELLDTLGICFCFAPVFHPAMKHVAPVRRKLGVPTVFNLLGPLTNPAGACFQLVGVGRAELRPLVGEALRRLGTRRAAVVHSQDGMDEISLAAPNQVSLIEGGQVRELCWEPEEFGLPRVESRKLCVKGPEESAERVRAILQGHLEDPAAAVVMANAAAALWVAGAVDSLKHGVQTAQDALQHARPWQLLQRWIEASR